MYTAAIRETSTNKFNRLNSTNVLDLLTHIQLDQTTYCTKSGQPGTFGTPIFRLSRNLDLITSDHPYTHLDQEDLYYYYSGKPWGLKYMSLDCYNRACMHESIDGFDDHDTRYRQSVPGAHSADSELANRNEQCSVGDYNCDCDFNMDHVDKIYDVFVEEKTCFVRFQKTRLVRTKTGMVSRGILFVEPVIESVTWSDDQKNLLTNIAKDNSWSLAYFHESPDGYDDGQAGMTFEQVEELGQTVRHSGPSAGKLVPVGDYVELIHKGLD